MLTSFNVLDRLQLDINVTENPFQISLDAMFSVGVSPNSKRVFLFISKLIGKHLEIHPDVLKATGYLLANRWLHEEEGKWICSIKPLIEFLETQESLPQWKKEEIFRNRYRLKQNTLFVGFAETATGLAHAVFSAFDNASFIHTTREIVSRTSLLLAFEETHSHAVDHCCYLRNKKLAEKAQHIVFIDDEITTGETVIHFIKEFHKVYPKQRYTVLSLMDWRTEEQENKYQQVEKELGVSIRVISLIKGTLSVQKDTSFSLDNPYSFSSVPLTPYFQISYPVKSKISDINKHGKEVSYLLYTGRFGLSSVVHNEVETLAKRIGTYLSKLRKGKKTLVLGMGEFIYIPSRIASYMGEGVWYKSTTRIPIYSCKERNYPVYDRIQFYDQQDETCYFLYNIQGQGYDEVFVIIEKEMGIFTMRDLAFHLQQKGIKHIYFVRL